MLITFFFSTKSVQTCGTPLVVDMPCFPAALSAASKRAVTLVVAEEAVGAGVGAGVGGHQLGTVDPNVGQKSSTIQLPHKLCMLALLFRMSFPVIKDAHTQVDASEAGLLLSLFVQTPVLVLRSGLWRSAYLSTAQ